MFNKKLKQEIAELKKALAEQNIKTETKADKEERERKEEIEKSWQELFNYNETIAIKGVK